MSTSDFDRDDELRALLRNGDPAGSLPPADPAALESLLEDIMSADLDVRPDDAEVRTAGPRGRSRLTWLVAAAAAAVIAGTGGFALSNFGGEDPAPPSAGPSTTTSGGDDSEPTAQGPDAPVAGETTELSVGDQAAKCRQPTPEVLAQYPQAFQGEVTAIDEATGTVTLIATDVYKGEVGQTVQVQAAPDLIGAMISAVDFRVGETYNVAVFEGRVSMCGYSGPASGETADLFAKAFLR